MREEKAKERQGGNVTRRGDRSAAEAENVAAVGWWGRNENQYVDEKGFFGKIYFFLNYVMEEKFNSRRLDTIN